MSTIAQHHRRTHYRYGTGQRSVPDIRPANFMHAGLAGVVAAVEVLFGVSIEDLISRD